MTIEITIKLETNELQELEKSGSELVAFILSQPNNLATKLVDSNSGVTVEKIKKERAKKAADKARQEKLEMDHQVLAEIIRNSTDLKSVRSEATKKTSLKRREIGTLVLDRSWLKQHDLPSLPEDDDQFKMTESNFKNEVINHFRYLLQGGAENGIYLEVHLEGASAAAIEHRNWRSNIMNDIAAGKIYNVAERHVKIDQIIKSAVQGWKDALDETVDWWILTEFKHGMFHISPEGARHILQQ